MKTTRNQTLVAAALIAALALTNSAAQGDEPWPVEKQHLRIDLQDPTRD